VSVIKPDNNYTVASKSAPIDLHKTIKFEISEDAQAYILENGGAIIVEMGTTCGA